MIIKKQYRFEASHQVHNDPGRCANLHGHSWVLTVEVSGAVDKETGMVLNYHDIDKFIKPLIERLDHTHLGSGVVSVTDDLKDGGHLWLGPSHEHTLPKVPTCENLLYWIAGELPLELSWSALSINETCTTEARLTQEEYRYRPEMNK